jgi:integrase/recombinase XerD
VLTRGEMYRRMTGPMRAVGSAASPHQLRHWYGTNVLLAAGGNLRVAQELLRHANLNATAIYTRVTSDQQADAVVALPDMTRPVQRLRSA